MRPRERATHMLSHFRLVKRAAPGAAPGTLIADPNAAATQVSAISYGPDGIEERAACTPDEIQALRSGAAVLWINVTGLADVSTIEAIGDAFELHDLTLEDVINVYQRPKFEAFEDHAFIVMRMPTPDNKTEQVSLFLGEGYVLTFQERPGDCFDPVRERIRRAAGRIRAQGADYLAYALIDAVIDGFFPVLETIGEDVEQLEDDVIGRPAPEQVDRLHHIKRELLMVRRAIWPTRDMVNALIRDGSRHVGESTRIYLRDCYDHTIQLMDIIETYREITSGLLDVYLSSLSTRMNEVMKLLTIIATIFIPLGFVAGLYGMNFDRGSPWNMPELGWHYGYFFALAVMAAIAFGLLFWFWRRGWIGKRGGGR